MDVLRRNTDYALRAMVILARHYNNRHQSTKKIARQQHIPYWLACKLMQRLNTAKLVASSMGPKGGFRLQRGPDKINLFEIIKAIQGPINLNRCMLGHFKCPLQVRCPIRTKLCQLQEQIEKYFSDITLADLLKKHSIKNNTFAIRRKNNKPKAK